MKPLPHNAAAEKELLACLLQEPKLIDSLGDLTPDDFYSPTLSGIAALVIKYIKDGKTFVDIAKALDYVPEFLALTDKLPITSQFDKYVRSVKQCSQLRIAIAALIDGAEQIRNNDSLSYADLTEKVLTSVVESLDIGATTNRCVHVRDALRDAYDRILELHAGSSSTVFLNTGLHDLDNLLSGMWPGDDIVIAGRPGMGKSALGLSIALHVSTHYKLPVVVFSLEMSNHLEAIRILSYETEIDSKRIRNGKGIGEGELYPLERAVHKYQDIPLYLDDTPYTTIGHIRSVANKIHRQCKGLGLIVVDYLQLMAPTAKKSRELEISEISRSLKALAKTMKIPVISLSQLNRVVESRTNKRPMLSDLRESGAIEQDADVVIMLYRDDYYKQDSDDKGTVELIIEKNRSGSTGIAKALFDRELTRFRNFDRR